MMVGGLMMVIFRNLLVGSRVKMCIYIPKRPCFEKLTFKNRGQLGSKKKYIYIYIYVHTFEHAYIHTYIHPAFWEYLFL